MGARFRKSVKICKGIKVNFSKSSASLSVGGAGHSLNYSAKGIRGTVGIPGSGLSYSTMLTSATGIGSFMMKMSENGQVSIYNANGIQITDSTIIRKIKSTAQYQSQKEKLEKQRQQHNDDLIRNSIAENEKFINIYKLSMPVFTREDNIKIVESLKPERYQRNSFNVAPPDKDVLLEQIQAEALTAITGNIFTVSKRRKQYVDEQLPIRFQEATEKWQQQRQLFEREEDSIEQAKNCEFETQHSLDVQTLYAQINGEQEAIQESIEKWMASCTFPVELDISYDWVASSNTLLLDVDLPAIEIIPSAELVKQANGNVKEKKKYLFSSPSEF